MHVKRNLMLALVLCAGSACRPSGDDATLTFFWRPSFAPHVAVRIEVRGTTCTVHATTFGQSDFLWSAPDSMGLERPVGVVPGPVEHHAPLRPAAAECRALEGQFEAAFEWDRQSPPNAPGIDGSDWTFEMDDARGHRMFSRFSPDSARAKPVWDAGIAALRIARQLPAEGRVF